MTGLVPLGDRVLVEPVPPPETTESGLVLMASSEPEILGRVLRVGSGGVCVGCGEAREPEVAVENLVLFASTSGQEITLDGVRYVLLAAREVLAVVTEDEHV